MVKSVSRTDYVRRPRVDPSFIDAAVEHILRASYQAGFTVMTWLQDRLSRRVAPLAGLNDYAAL
ncbi:MAG: hypothetical protein AAGH38_02705 [Pseudomonadota bacterium]